VFVDVNDSSRTVTGDRKEFIGRNGSLAQPAALKRACLSGKVGAGLDPCGAVQVVFDLAIAQERETSFRLGVGRDLADVQSLIHRFRLADGAFADRCLEQAQRLQHNIERHAWDGQWYRRAYFDNGEALGSQTNAECQIDSLPQSWAVISGAGEAGRTRQAMLAVDQRLVHRQTGLIQLFDPPFDSSSSNPGYIKGYIPGVRENGGQYTHAAIWSATAFALLGDSERAWELFSLLNPIHHGSTPEQVATYKAEPYVVAADVYALPPHTGRGGWSWYTGAAAWMYRLLVETLLGINLEGDKLRLKPLLPAAWPACKIHYRYRQTIYHISVTRLSGEGADEPSLALDGERLVGDCLRLSDDGLEHTVEMLVR